MTDEAKLLSGAQKFDEEVLAEIYDLYSPELYRYSVRQLGDPEVAEDCVADTFSGFLNALRKKQGPRQYLRAYLYRIAHNWITDSYRRQPPPQVELDPEMQASLGEGPAEVMEIEMQNEQVRAALAKLTPDQRQVVVLKYLEDWKNKEIAQALGKPIGAVKALQHRGIAALRKGLVPQE